MKNILGIMRYLFLALILYGCTEHSEGKRWVLAWEENFNDRKLDTAVWSRIPRGMADWNNYMAPYEELVTFTDSTVRLLGVVNTSHPEDTAKYLTGGIWSKGKKGFHLGRVEIRAKVQSAQGFWPALWMVPHPIPYPYGGEIDIMEHLNHDDFVYQTSHSYYTIHLNRHDPPKFATALIDKEEFNTYAVEIYPDSLVYFTNGIRSYGYPKVNDGKDGQFPFAYDPFDLRIDAQLGGGWVGAVDKQQLPVYLEVDWVKYYEKSEKYLK